LKYKQYISKLKGVDKLKNVIFYFSGTGNNLSVARHIANRLKDTEIIHVSNLEDTLAREESYERIGFTFPIYYLHMPGAMKEIISKVKFKVDQYIFGVSAHAGNSGMAMEDLREIINKQNGKLSAEFRVRMPGSYIAQYGAFPKFICNLLYKREQKKILEISLMIKRKDSTDIIKPGIIAKLSEKSSIKEITNFKKKDEYFNVNDKCLHCEVCKNVCPVNNIEMTEGKPKWKNNCEQCMACIQWCPTHAINFSYKTQNRKRYFHPEVKVKDIIKDINKKIEVKGYE